MLVATRRFPPLWPALETTLRRPYVAVGRAAHHAAGRVRTPLCRLYVALARMGDRARGLGRATTSLGSVGLQCDGGRGQWAVSHHRLANQRQGAWPGAPRLTNRSKVVPLS